MKLAKSQTATWPKCPLRKTNYLKKVQQKTLAAGKDIYNNKHIKIEGWTKGREGRFDRIRTNLVWWLM